MAVLELETMGLRPAPQSAVRAVPGLPVCDIDPFSYPFFDDPYPFYAQVREAGPVAWIPRYGVWGVGRFAEVRDILLDWRTFVSSRGVGLADFGKETPWRVPSLLLETDPPEHDRARAVVQRVLAGPTLRTLQAQMAAEADRFVEALLAVDAFDGVRDLAEPYPLKVFPDALGMPADGRENLLPFAAQSFNNFGPRNELWRQAMENAAPVREWAMDQCRRPNLKPGGFGAQIHEAVDAGAVTDDEAILLVRSLLGAGVDTTINSIGTALYCLARFPEQHARLHAKPTLARATFDEAIRYEGPVQTFFRTTSQATEIAGVPIEAGQKVALFLASANRDPRKFADPDRFDIERKGASGHVGFGVGVHTCVGQMLARIEAETLLSAIGRRVARIELLGPPERLYNNTLRGLKALPIRFHAA